MDDFISRKTAVQGVRELFSLGDCYCDEFSIVGMLNQLQSAQPEIVRCKDCKHGRPYNHTKEYVSCEVDCDSIDRDSDFFCAYGERRE